MFTRLKSLLRPPERKSSTAARLIAIESGGRARGTPRDYAALAREGYTRNAIVHRAVRLTAESIGALSFVLYEGAAELTAHPLLDLLARPNPRQDGASFLESVASHLLLAGNAYIEAVGIDAVEPGAGKCASFTRCGPTA
jgi:phage portal protein BeeE